MTLKLLLNYPFAKKKVLKKTLLIMKLTAILLFATCLQVSATGYSQNVTLSQSNVSLKQVFKEIENQSGYQFFYKDKLVRQAENVSIHVSNVSVEEALDQCLKDQPLTYTIFERIIVVKAKQSVPVAMQTLSILPPAPLNIITGIVKDEKGNPLVGVSVIIKGSQKGTSTNANGHFSIDANVGDVLEFSFVGYKNKSVTIGTNANISIQMEVEATSGSEIVVVGYGTQKKSDLTGAITSLSSDDLTKGGAVSNVAQSLQGRASGVVVIQNSKAPGGSMSVRIRGSNSISSSNEPLYVVDGFPTDDGFDINPDDVESMEILKDASATAIYGSRGANGVVLITTKRGVKGKSNISYSGYTGVQKIIRPFDLLDAKQYMLLANEHYKEVPGQENVEFGAYTQSELNSDVNTDWIDVTTRNGVVESHNIQARSGGDKTRVLSSIGYFKQEGILKNTNFDRISGRVNIDQQINDYINTGMTIMAQRETSNFQRYASDIRNSNVLGSILSYSPTVPVYNADGTFSRPPGGKGDNPLANLLARKNDVQNDKLNGVIYFEVKPIKGLTSRVSAGTEILHDKVGSYLTRESYQGSIDDGVANLGSYSRSHNLVEVVTTYTTVLQDKHSFSLMGGYSYEKSTNENMGVNVRGFSTDLFSFNNLGAASSTGGVQSYKAENILISLFGRVNYSFDNKYIVTLTVRKDGSSRFGEENKWGTFPSGSFAWKVSNEPFMANQTIFSDLKIRGGYGKTGNERIGDYASNGLVSNAHYTFDGIHNTSGSVLNNTVPENNKLKWETTSQFNLGTDMSFFNHRLSITIDAYYKKTKDLLIQIGLPSYTGYLSGLSNLGSIENKGLEFALESRNFVKEFSWNTRLNFAITRNKVLSIGINDQKDIPIISSKPNGSVSEESYAIIRVGEPLGSLYGYKYAGVMQEGEKYGPQPNSVPGDPKFIDINGDGLITPADRTIIGSAYPKLTYGITNTFEYKNLDLSLFIFGSLGNDLLNLTRQNLELSRSTRALDRWTTKNTNTDIPRDGFYSSKYGGYINDYFVEDASFLRLKNITLGYTIPLKVKALKSLRFYAMAENLITLTNYSGWDPEVDTKGNESKTRNYDFESVRKVSSDTQTANAGAGMDFNSYPSMRVYTIGININF